MIIDTSKMPSTFGLCIATEVECPKAGMCLRSLVFRQQEAAGENGAFIRVLNPYKTENQYATEKCTYYSSCQKERYACGMSRIFADVKTADYRAVRDGVMECFSCESFFYRSQNGTRLITPKEQAKIAQVFREMNVGAEPKFDSYVEQYSWK